MPFFLLVLDLSIPLWILGPIVGGELLPGLPVSAVQFLCPVTAASLLLYRHRGAAAVGALLKRSFDFARIADPVRYILVLLLIPAAYGLSYVVMLILGRPLAAPELNVLAIPPLLVVFFFAGLAEELGWSAYALDPMQHRWGALRRASARRILGDVALGAAAAGRAVVGLDWVVVAELGIAASLACLALQQHWEECIWPGAVPCGA